jgi:hypothetical protein
MDPEDVLALGGLIGALIKSPDLQVEVFQDEDGYYEEFFDVIVHNRRLRFRCETTSAADSAADLVDLLDELGGT